MKKEDIKLPQGVFLDTKQQMIEAQEQWDFDDDARFFNFSIHEFWLTTDDGTMPIGFDSIEAIEKYLKTL